MTVLLATTGRAAMDEPIKRGDLVVLIRKLPCGHGDIGKIGTVEKIYPTGNGGDCRVCRTFIKGQPVAALSNGDHFYINRLKRIPPLGELDEIPTKEVIEA